MTRAAAGRLALGVLLLAAVVVAGALLAERVAARARGPVEALPAPAADFSLPPPPPPTVVLRHRISAGDTLGAILGGYGVDAAAVREAALPHHDLASLRVGRDLVLVYDDSAEEVAELRYSLGEDHEVVVVHDGAEWAAHLSSASYQATLVRREFTVQATLWDAALGAGLRAADIVALSKVFESDIDFNTEVQAGARVQVVVEELVRDDGFTKLGPPLAARFINVGKSYDAFRFQAGEAERPDYYDAEGFNRRGAFLRSPLEFSRVTSGFSTGRFHPVLKTKRPHLGTDFGAPTGTPVRTVARGKVLQAGRNGGHGNYVEIQHDGGYKTSYSHLSRILVKRGEVVAQGQTIGKVGSTGLSTGPHLHFQLWVRGRIVDAMKADLPRHEQLSASAMPAFEAWRDRVRPVLDGTASPDDLELPP